MSILLIFKTLGLFILTAIAEIIGCYLPYLWLVHGHSVWLLLPAALSLVVFVYLLTLHPAESGRVYAAYGGIYVLTAIAWLRLVDKSPLTGYDLAGAALVLCGMVVIAYGWK